MKFYVNPIDCLAADRLLPLPKLHNLGAPRIEEEAPSMRQSLSRTSFVGRMRELDELNGGLEGALAGHGRLFLISGEPGIGKTRLAEQLATHASERHALVIWGRCWEGSGAPAYWPWIQIFRLCVCDQGFSP